MFFASSPNLRLDQILLDNLLFLFNPLLFHSPRFHPFEFLDPFGAWTSTLNFGQLYSPTLVLVNNVVSIGRLILGRVII